MDYFPFLEARETIACALVTNSLNIEKQRWPLVQHIWDTNLVTSSFNSGGMVLIFLFFLNQFIQFSWVGIDFLSKVLIFCQACRSSSDDLLATTKILTLANYYHKLPNAWPRGTMGICWRLGTCPWTHSYHVTGCALTSAGLHLSPSYNRS